MTEGNEMRKNSNRGRNQQPQPVTDTETVTQQRPAHIDSGEDARGAVNARENQTRTQPQPSPAITALGDSVVSMRPPKGVRGSLLETRREVLSNAGATKHQILNVTKQRLAEAADLFNEGGGKEREGRAIVDKASTELYTARANGVLSADELSSLLGDTFGWKAKKGPKDAPVKGGDPDASKTPFGYGEAVRKRVVRAVQAHEYVTGADTSRFFEGLPTDKVSDLLQQVETGTLSLWTAYDYMGNIKSEAATRINPAFDPKAVAKLVEALREPGAAQKFLANSALQDAYLAMHDMIIELDREAAALKREAA
jgi:hypothetical protein